MVEVHTNESQVPASDDGIASLRVAELDGALDSILQLLSQPRLGFVLGAGTSKCAGLPLMSELADAVLKGSDLGESERAIVGAIMERYKGGTGCTLEDYMSELVDQISLADRRSARAAKQSGIELGAKTYSAADLLAALNAIKAGIARVIDSAETSIECHRRFIRAIHGRFRSGKAPQNIPVDYVTLNYDTLLEDALALERITAADGFLGGTTGWWNADAYDDPSARARVFKIHGSIDWCVLEDDPMPRRVRKSLKREGQKEPIVIWPAATKYRETQRDPYAQIIGRMRATFRPRANNDLVIAIVGYGFRDEHINQELDRALRESEGRLTLVVFTSDDRPTGILEQWLNDVETRERVRIHANRGFYHGETAVELGTDILWWRFEVLVRVLGGEK